MHPIAVSLLIRKPNHLQATTIRPVSVQLQELFGLECNCMYSVFFQDAAKFMHHAKRLKLSTTDIDHALKVKNIEASVCFYCYVFSVTAYVKLLDWFPTSQKNTDL